MAHKGIGFFDRRGHYFKTPEDATVSDLAALLGRIGEGDSLAPGIAQMLLERREEILLIFAEYDEMRLEYESAKRAAMVRLDNVAQLPERKKTEV